MKLYYSPGTCALSPHIALREAGLDAELVKVDLRTHTTADGGDYYAINPRGYVPVLELDGGERLTEGPAIVQFLADLAPASGLAPAAGTMQRVRLQEWLGFVNSELHKLVSPLWDPSTHESTRETIGKKLRQRLDWTATQLADGQFLLGDAFTVADGYLFVVLGWLKPMGFEIADWPVLADYHRRIAARPAVQAALREQGLLR